MGSAFDKLRKRDNLDGINTSSGNKTPRIEDSVQLIDFSDGRWHQVRLIPGVFAFCQMWVDITKKDMSITQIPLVLRNVDIHTGVFDSTISCPYMKNLQKFTNKGETGGKISTYYYVNLIDRDQQDREPKKNKISKDEKKSGFKDIESSSWTAARVAKFPKTIIDKVQKLQQMNTSGKGSKRKSYNVSDPKKGIDIMVMFDNTADGANKWDVQLCHEKGSKKPLSDRERQMLFWNIEDVIKEIVNNETEDEAKARIKGLLDRIKDKSKKDKSKKDKSKKDKSKKDKSKKDKSKKDKSKKDKSKKSKKYSDSEIPF